MDSAFAFPFRTGAWSFITTGLIRIMLVMAIGAEAWGQPAGQDKAQCKRNLRLIYDAVQAYRLAHQDLPGSLSELVPVFLADPEILFCPEARRKALTSIAATGRPGFSDPRTSYFYEFSNVPVDEFPDRTNRDWKRAQMGLLGSVVPIVRCLVHDHPINLSFGGDIYECDRLEWEYKFTNLVPFAQLTVESLLFHKGAARVIEVPTRDPTATRNEVDLSELYNASLSRPWLAREPTRRLVALPRGLQELAGTRFDVRGVIQLSSRGLASLGELFPDRVSIPLNRVCHEVRFLIGASLTDKPGVQSGRLDIRFDDGVVEQVPLRRGEELECTWPAASSLPARESSARVAWQGPGGQAPRLFLFAWTNPRPAVQIRLVDGVGGTTGADFFVVAVSVVP